MDYEKLLSEHIGMIKPADRNKYNECMARWNTLAKPLYSLGVLEQYVSKIFSINSELRIDKKCVAVICADNGVVEEGVTQTSCEVTFRIAQLLAEGQASVCKMAQIAGADVLPYDAGMKSAVKGVPVIQKKRGTDNFFKGPAMTRAEAAETVMAGIEVAAALKGKGYNLIACGEMGIGNTTTSSAAASAMLSCDAEEVTGRGAGLSDNMFLRKVFVIKEAINKHAPDRNDALDILSKVGGFDLAAMCGLYLGGGIFGTPVIADGFISCVSALLAKKLCPAVTDYILPSHRSKEKGSSEILKELSLCAPLELNMALGEGTGAVTLMPILDMAVNYYSNMPTFDQISISRYQPL